MEFPLPAVPVVVCSWGKKDEAWGRKITKAIDRLGWI
jgi:hypothetical protein